MKGSIFKWSVSRTAVSEKLNKFRNLEPQLKWSYPKITAVQFIRSLSLGAAEMPGGGSLWILFAKVSSWRSLLKTWQLTVWNHASIDDVLESSYSWVHWLCLKRQLMERIFPLFLSRWAEGSHWETWMFGWKRKWVRTLWSIMEWAQCLATIEGRSVCRSRCSWSNQNKPCLGNTRQKPGYIRFTPHQIARRFGCSTIVD